MQKRFEIKFVLLKWILLHPAGTKLEQFNLYGLIPRRLRRKKRLFHQDNHVRLRRGDSLKQTLPESSGSVCKCNL